MQQVFAPKLFSVLKKGYTMPEFTKDLTAGIIVGIVALPLSIAFAIASGVSPDKGLITAIIAGFLISLLGGSRVQIGGPTGAFVVIIYTIVEQHGLDVLIVSTFLAGLMLIALGLFRMGVIIRYVPFPLVAGFTSGIAVIIFTTQVKDFLGLSIAQVPGDFLGKWYTYLLHIDTFSIWAFLIALFSFAATLLVPRISTKIPGSLVAILVSTFAVIAFNLPVETIETRFNEIPSTIPMPGFPVFSIDKLSIYISSAFTIAILGAIESLLSAVVADGMISGNHRSNTELIGQGIANIASSFFGGLPATGAIARTATNVKNGGRTPVAGMVHAVVLLLIMLVLGRWAKLIPLASLAGILVVVAYNMSEWRTFKTILRNSSNDALVLVSTFLLTVLIDLTIAIEIGMVLAAFLFMRRMAQVSNVRVLTTGIAAAEDERADDGSKLILPDKSIEVYEVNGPFFFGAAIKFRDIIEEMHSHPKVLIIRMRYVPFMDATGAHNLKEMIKSMHSKKITVVLSGVQDEVYQTLAAMGLKEQIGEANITDHISKALERAHLIVHESQTANKITE